MLFKRATGWLGWTPGVTRRASIFDIEAALDGKVEFARLTNPWGSGEAEKSATKEPKQVAHGLAALLRGHSVKGGEASK